VDNVKNQHQKINFESCKMGNKNKLKDVEDWALKVRNFLQKLIWGVKSKMTAFNRQSLVSKNHISYLKLSASILQGYGFIMEASRF